MTAQRIGKRVLEFAINRVGFESLFDEYPHLREDTKYMKFTAENIVADNTFLETDEQTYIGFHTINNLTFLGMLVGGEDEIPIFMIVYLDITNKLRAYIPQNGNLYNRENNSTYGYDAVADSKILDQLDYNTLDDLYNSLKYDWNEIVQEISSMINVA